MSTLIASSCGPNFPRNRIAAFCAVPKPAPSVAGTTDRQAATLRPVVTGGAFESPQSETLRQRMIRLLNRPSMN